MWRDLKSKIEVLIDVNDVESKKKEAGNVKKKQKKEYGMRIIITSFASYFFVLWFQTPVDPVLIEPQICSQWRNTMKRV